MKAIIDTGCRFDGDVPAFLEIAKTYIKIKVFLVLSQWYVEGSKEDVQAFLDEAGIKVL